MTSKTSNVTKTERIIVQKEKCLHVDDSEPTMLEKYLGGYTQH